MTERLMLTEEQYVDSLLVLNNKQRGIFDPVLLDERTPDGDIITVLEYDEESIMIQRVDKRGLTYNIVPRCEFLSGAIVQS